ncbi:hypothetical protein BJ878DRAFT_538722 [Calycina marina]|uniref:RING-type E3 ubiquitin transferase n=1 Tax=Calycina marina TaxID=1763456 RepID=A0A9P7ZA51_9HELO|nr:hypothetical protein BJ878DRAFT_538722 [Calycina marina]
MSNPYEVEHNIKGKPKTANRRPSMSSFYNAMQQIEINPSSHSNPHATPTPVDMAAAMRLLQDQYHTLLSTTSSPQTSSLLETLTEALELQIYNPPTTVEGVNQAYLDELERVDKKTLKEEDTCPICAEKFLDDAYPLVVELPCHKTHRFDLECVGPWLRLNGTCPLDRRSLVMKKDVVKKNEGEEEEEVYDDLYA